MLSDKEVHEIKGLTEGEALYRLNKYGYNELPEADKKKIFTLLIELISEPMFLLLLGCTLVYLIIGDVHEALILAIFVIFIISLTIYQENKTENSLKALRNLSSPRALVIREGTQKRIAGREVVIDDIIIVQEGDRVPADAVVIWNRNLMVDESILTGESVPVRKISIEGNNIMPQEPGGDDKPFIYSGSLVVKGQGIAKVIATGSNTFLGKIGKSLQKIEQESTLLQKNISYLVKIIFSFAVLLFISVILIHGFIYRNWVQGILAGITLAMAIIPEEFPVVLTIFLAIGAWRLSKKKVLTRRIEAVELLGSTTVLCVDKTGTLTENKMKIEQIYSNGEVYNIRENQNEKLPEQHHEIIEYGILASKEDPFDPMEKALKDLGTSQLSHTEHLHNNEPLIVEYPLSPNLLALSHVWKLSNKKGYVVSTKGAPEAIAELCHLSENETKIIFEQTKKLAEDGLRVIGVAKASFDEKKLPESQHDFDFKFLGLIGLFDPIKKSVIPALNECYKAGIRVIMVTGDHPSTAYKIGKLIGLKNPENIITGLQLQELQPSDILEKIKEVNIFARILPEQKLLIVDYLKKLGEITAMTGDGINDAPALKSAHIGIAMGNRGTDVAREAADIVLLDDDFSNIVEAIKQGRKIFDNLRKAMAYIISVHIPIAGISLLPIIFRLPLIIYPIHVVFLELIIDPACSMVFESEPEEKNLMERPPRDPKRPIFSIKLLSLSILQGIFSLLVVMALYAFLLNAGLSEDSARTSAFVTLISSNLCLILANRSWTKNIINTFSYHNKALYLISAIAIFFLIIIIYTPFLRKSFYFSELSLSNLLISFAAGLLSVGWFELLKFFAYRKNLNLLD
jgi:Ca2+-transporting ATPase